MSNEVRENIVVEKSVTYGYNPSSCSMPHNRAIQVAWYVEAKMNSNPREARSTIELPRASWPSEPLGRYRAKLKTDGALHSRKDYKVRRCTGR